jgi:hypothetical protein
MEQPHRPKGLPVLDLTSVFGKLDRAEEHFKALDSEIKRWLESGRYEPTFERGAKGTRISIALTQVGPPPDLVRWSVIAGDCFNNLRSCLDHLVYSYAKFQTANDPTADIDNLAFVIADTAAEFHKRRKTRLSVFSDQFCAMIESLQPYRRQHPVLPPLLSIIRDLSNADKHRLLQVAAAGITMMKANFVGDDTLGKKVPRVNPYPIEQHDVVCIIESDQPDPNLAFHMGEFGVEICIWHRLRDGDTEQVNARTGYSVLIPLLIQEIRFVIEQFGRAS